MVRLETATRSPSLDRLFVLADVLGMSLGQLAEAFERVDAPDDSGGSAEASAADAVRW